MGGPPQVWSPVEDHQTPCMFTSVLECILNALFLFIFYWGCLRVCPCLHDRLRDHRSVVGHGRPCNRDRGRLDPRRLHRRSVPEPDECRSAHPVFYRAPHRDQQRHVAQSTADQPSHGRGRGLRRRLPPGRPQRLVRPQVLGCRARAHRAQDASKPSPAPLSHPRRSVRRTAQRVVERHE